MGEELLWATKNGDLEKVKSVVSESKSIFNTGLACSRDCYFVFSLVLTLTKSSVGGL